MPRQRFLVNPPEPQIPRKKIPESAGCWTPEDGGKRVAERHGVPHNNAAEAGAVGVGGERACGPTRQPEHAAVVAARAGGGVKSARPHEDHLGIGRDYVEKLHGSKGGKVFVGDQMADVIGVAAGAER